ARRDKADIEAAISSAFGNKDLSSKLEGVSGYFLGRPYLDNPLGGGPDQNEKLSVSTRGFDCVTFIETVLAASQSRNMKDFVSVLKRIRYQDGQMSWTKRNHYMVGWARQNQAAGFVRDLTLGAAARKHRRHLNIVPGVKPRTVTFRSFPKRWVVQSSSIIRTGDILVFASTRKNLDAFHVGLAICGTRLLLRHASRTARTVIDEELEAFLKRHRMSGVMVLRPVCQPSA